MSSVGEHDDGRPAGIRVREFAARNSAATSAASNRSRFFENVE